MSFYDVRVDNALDHISGITKATIGLMGITQNASALGFLMISPVLGRFTEKAHKMAGSPTATRKGT